MKKNYSFKHSNCATFLALFILTLIAFGAWCFFPPHIHAEDLDVQSFCSISFYVAFFIFPFIYFVVNIQNLGWLGLLFALFDTTITIYLVMWTHSAVYWSPLIVAFFNYILVNNFIRENKFICTYDNFAAMHIGLTYLLGGFVSGMLWLLFHF